MASVLTLLVPGCCGPLPIEKKSLPGLDSKALGLPLWQLLSRADILPAGDDFFQQLAVLFNLESDKPLPYAALDLLGEDGAPGDAFWMHVDPVCMQADIDHAILFDSHSLRVTDEEADILISELNQHFSDDGILIQRGSAASWYIRPAASTRVSTYALHDVVGRNVNRFMPVGDDQQYWRRFMNEAQMLLYSSDVNQQREARGELPVNSLWLWGEGRLPGTASEKTNFDIVLSDNACVRGLAKLQCIDCQSVPGNINAFLDVLVGKKNICMVLDDLVAAKNYADISLWQEKIVALYESWLGPLISYTYKNKVALDLYPCNGSAYQLRARQGFRFWRRGDIAQHLKLYA